MSLSKYWFMSGKPRAPQFEFVSEFVYPGAFPTFANIETPIIPFGPPDRDRRLYAFLTYEGQSSSADIGAVTIGGVSASRLAGAGGFTSSNGTRLIFEIWAAEIPDGSSGVITFDPSATGPNYDGLRLALYRGVGYALSATPKSGLITGGGVVDLSVVVSEGSAMALSCWAQSQNPVTFTFTEEVEAEVYRNDVASQAISTQVYTDFASASNMRAGTYGPRATMINAPGRCEFAAFTISRE